VFDPDAVRDRTRAYCDALARTDHDMFHDELDTKAYDLDLLDRFAARIGRGGGVLDAGRGPCRHVARRLAAAGLEVRGIDLSPECVRIARDESPELPVDAMAMEATAFPDASFDGVVAYYSILYTPRTALPAVGAEFRRVLRPRGARLVAVKEGTTEGFVPDPMGTGLETFFATFTQAEIEAWLAASGFACAFADTREAYPFEAPVRWMYAIEVRGAVRPPPADQRPRPSAPPRGRRRSRSTG
jgi:SAM-dependent methyltransferase